jgi:hypothetical protein
VKKGRTQTYRTRGRSANKYSSGDRQKNKSTAAVAEVRRGSKGGSGGGGGSVSV